MKKRCVQFVVVVSKRRKRPGCEEVKQEREDKSSGVGLLSSGRFLQGG